MPIRKETAAGMYSEDCVQRPFLFPAESKKQEMTASDDVCLEIYGLFARLPKGL
jgi:hypothetical protein